MAPSHKNDKHSEGEGYKDMKKKTLELGNWQTLFQEKDWTVMPEGYSTVDEISRRSNLSKRTIREMLKNARDKGQIDAIRGKTKTGQVAWFYKD